ncbi:hypothetical protein FKM82_024064 [Ascaphus truei]
MGQHKTCLCHNYSCTVLPDSVTTPSAILYVHGITTSAGTNYFWNQANWKPIIIADTDAYGFTCSPEQNRFPILVNTVKYEYTHTRHPSP